MQAVALNSPEPNLVIINAASKRTSGKRMCKDAHKNLGAPVILVTTKERKEAGSPFAVSVLAFPFSSRKLQIRIKKYIKSGDKRTIVHGPITLYPEDCLVRVGVKNTCLTPKAYALLAALLARKGKVANRKSLMRAVWKSDKPMGRTLDVHIRWLREAIEGDAGEAELIETVRGVGYRLNLGDTPD